VDEPLVEIRIPISPEPHFFNQIRLLANSLRTNGGVASDARIVVSVGADCEPYDLHVDQPWSRGLVEWRWADRQQYLDLSYFATHSDRFSFRTDARFVLLLDADTLMIRNMDDILARLQAQPAIAGVMAHRAPFAKSDGSWSGVFKSIGRSLPATLGEHSGWGAMPMPEQHRFGPPYFNYGMIFIPSDYLGKLNDTKFHYFDVARQTPMIPVFSAQFAFTLAVLELGMPWTALSQRYNYPNDPRFDAAFPTELEDARLIHFLREDIIGPRRQLWANDDSIAAFLSREDLGGSNEILRKAVSELRA
jgi:hypothetical protein